MSGRFKAIQSDLKWRDSSKVLAAMKHRRQGVLAAGAGASNHRRRGVRSGRKCRNNRTRQRHQLNRARLLSQKGLIDWLIDWLIVIIIIIICWVWTGRGSERMRISDWPYKWPIGALDGRLQDGNWPFSGSILVCPVITAFIHHVCIGWREGQPFVWMTGARIDAQTNRRH